MQGNGVVQETPSEILAVAIERLRRILPTGWEVGSSLESSPVEPRWDVHLTFRAPDGSAAGLLALVKTGGARSAELVVTQLRQLAEDSGRPVMLVTPYAGPALRQRCEAGGVSYLDLTGWCWFESSAPAIAIRAVGADRDPRPPRTGGRGTTRF